MTTNGHSSAALNAEIEALRRHAADLEQQLAERDRTERALRHQILTYEQAQHESEGYYLNLFNELPVGLALCRMDGSLVDINQAYAQIIGRTIEETLRLTYWDITPPKYAEQEQIQVKHLEVTGRYGPYEKEYTHKDGHLVPVRLSAKIVERQGERFIWSSVEDISESKRSEEAMRRSLLQDEIIKAQEAALAELSTPLIPFSDQVVVMPLVGAMDSRRAQQVMDTILHGVAESRAQVVILDITGVALVDTRVANALIQVAQAAKLLGAQAVLTGIRPEVAQALVGLGVDLSGIVTRSTLQSGIAFAIGKN